MGKKARMDSGLIASLRESARQMRPEASLTTPTTADGRPGDESGHSDRAVLENVVARVRLIEERLQQLDRSHAAGDEIEGHILFVQTAAGYTIVERDGPAPRPGDHVVVEGHTYRADHRRHSPFPADARPCVTVQLIDIQ